MPVATYGGLYGWPEFGCCGTFDPTTVGMRSVCASVPVSLDAHERAQLPRVRDRGRSALDLAAAQIKRENEGGRPQWKTCSVSCSCDRQSHKTP